MTWDDTTVLLDSTQKAMHAVHIKRGKDGYTPKQELELKSLRAICKHLGDVRYALLRTAQKEPTND